MTASRVALLCLTAVILTASFGGACIQRNVTPTGVATSAAASNAPAPAYAPPGPKPGPKYGQVKGLPIVAAGAGQFALQGDRAKVAISVIAVEPAQGQPFTEAVRAEVKAVPANPWDFQILVHNTQPIKKGDVVLATFWFRAEKSLQESGEGQTELVFELAHPPWTKSTSFQVRAAREWRQFHVPFLAEMDYPVGQAKLNFRLGFQAQTIDIADVSVESFGHQLALSDLPVTQLTYRGMEPEARWRKAAAERIEKVRKADLAVLVKDRMGQRLIGAEVRARLTRHAFGFGTAINPAMLNGPDAEKYKQAVVELFNIATLENHLKWAPLAGDWGRAFTLDAARNAIAWLRGQRLDVRGHVLVWPGWQNLPRALKAHAGDPAYLRDAVSSHIREVASAVKGTVVHWDVVNEPFDNHDLLDILGEGAMVDWFKQARAVDPGAKLFINDYAILSGGGGDSPHRAHYEKTIKQLIAKGAPLDGVGMQGHFGSALTGPDDLLAILDRYAKLGKPIWVTEYDVVVDDQDVAGKYTRDFYTTLFSHPAVQGILMWGFWDGAHWKSNAPLYRRDWTLKPGGEAFRKLVLETWRTDAAGKTDGEGKFATRGFLGDYTIEVSFGGRTKRLGARLDPAGSAITVLLD